MLLGSVLAVSGLVCLLAAARRRSAAEGEADLAQMKRQMVDYWIGVEADRSDPQVAASLAQLEQSAREAFTSMRPDGSWKDLHYDTATSDDPGSEFRVSQHVSRVATMAEAFRTQGQPFCGDPELCRAIEQSLSFVCQAIGEDWPTDGGWWQLQIHQPRKLGETLLLMEAHLTPALIEQVKRVMRGLLMEEAPRGQGVIWHTVLYPTDAPPGEKHQATGENMVWLGQNHLYLALLNGDTKLAATVQAEIANQCLPHRDPTVGVQNEGIKEDYSFHQHGSLLYTGGYGRSFFEDVPQYLWSARGTRWQLPAESIEGFAHYALDSTHWCVYQNYYDPSCQGREITRPERRPMPVPFALLALANLPHPRQEQSVSAAKSFYQVSPSYHLRTASLWAAIKDRPIAASAPVGHRHFWSSDYTVHRGADYFASLRMFSNRTRPAECIHMEGKTSWHQSNGLLWVFLRGGDYAANNVLPTLDWLRLPGITVERKPLKPTEGFEGWPPPLGHRAFVGGAFTEDSGVSAMELEAMVPPLTAKKSWLFFGDEIVCLGSDINCPSDHPAETTVNQWPLTEAAAPFTVDGQLKPSSLPWSEDLQTIAWAHCDGIGYYFPESHPLKLKREVQRGSWHDMSDGQSNTVHEHPFLTLWFDHGVQAKDAAYAYALLPRRTAAQTKAYADARALTIFAHDGKAHAVQQSARGATGVVFWEPGSVGKLSVDRACLAYYEETAEGLVLAVSDPTHASSTIQVTIDEALTAAQLPPQMESKVAGGKTVLTLRAERGHNYVARFDRQR